jgi:hypothetical protein
LVDEREVVIARSIATRALEIVVRLVQALAFMVAAFPSRHLKSLHALARGALCTGVGRADARTRTGDPFITSEVLYQLSYVGGSARV